MKFSVQNLGRLAEATIDLDKDLILFVGPNNTSKTYVALTIYGFYARILTMLREELVAAVDSITAVEHDPSSLDINVQDLITRKFPTIITAIEKGYQSELFDVLAASEEFVSLAQISVSIAQESESYLKDFFRDAHEQDSEVYQASDYEISVLVQSINLLRFQLKTLKSGSNGRNVLQRFAAVYLARALATILFDRAGDTFILPAERAAIQLFSRELSAKRSQLIDELLSTAARKRRGANEAIASVLQHGARRYPAGIRAYLDLANDLTAKRQLTSLFAPLADRLDQMIGGSLHVGEDGDLLFQPAPEGPKLHLHLASSSVKALAGLSFHLRHLLNEGDILIIDEPELNLHPDNQRRVARVIAQLARSGVKVIVSTHSDYFIRELNNLIMLSADGADEVRERLGYIAEETLEPSRVGAYLFDTTRARPLEVTQTGIEVETIDREINALNATSQDIYFSLFNKA